MTQQAATGVKAKRRAGDQGRPYRAKRCSPLSRQREARGYSLCRCRVGLRLRSQILIMRQLRPPKRSFGIANHTSWS